MTYFDVTKIFCSAIFAYYLFIILSYVVLFVYNYYRFYLNYLQDKIIRITPIVCNEEHEIRNYGFHVANAHTISTIFRTLFPSIVQKTVVRLGNTCLTIESASSQLSAWFHYIFMVFGGPALILLGWFWPLHIILVVVWGVDRSIKRFLIRRNKMLLLTSPDEDKRKLGER